jgi:hypothetical protein
MPDGVTELSLSALQASGRLALAVLLCLSLSQPVAAQTLVLSRADYRERLHGFWLGQSVANWTGLVTEMDRVEAPFYTDADWGKWDEPAMWGRYAAHAGRIDYYLLPPDRVWGADDDTDIEYLYLELMHGGRDPLLSATQIRDGWLRHIYSNEDAPLSSSEFQRENYLWVSNERAYYLMRDQGLLPPETGQAKHNPDYAMIDAQLTTELFGLMAPARPDIALALARLPIGVTASGESAAIARFYVVMHSLAVMLQPGPSLAEDLFTAAERASAQLPEGGYARDMYTFVRDAYRANPALDSWAATRDAVYREYQVGGRAGYGYRQPFDAGINFAASLVSLFYGGGDFAQTLRIATLAGWDSDNPAATWGGLLGFVYGERGVEAAVGGDALSELYWIHRTRRNFPDRTPGLPGEDSFTLMAERGVEVVDRVVAQHAEGLVDRNGDLWRIPMPASAAAALQ